MKRVLFISFLFACISGVAQSNQSPVIFNNPQTLSTPKGYSHVAVIDLGNSKMLILSGQVSLDAQGNLVGKGDITRQTEQVFTNIKNAIIENGGTMHNIVKLGYYLVDGTEIQPIRDVRDKFINTKNPPVSTLVKISKLFRDDLLVEIEATCIIPKK